MQNILGKCLALGIVAGGFVVTGDLSRLVARGMRMLEVTDVPSDGAQTPVSGPRAPVGPAGVSSAAVDRRRPPAGPDRIDLGAIPSGARIFMWLDTAPEPVCLDVVDPAAAAVVLQRGTTRRGTIVGGALVRGEPVHLVPLGVAYAGTPAPAESLGVIAGLRFDRVD